MSAEITTKRMTAEEFCDWVHRPAQTNKWFELVRGEVIELPPPFKPHGAITFNISRILGGYVYASGKGYCTSNDAGVILERDPDTVRGPDIAYYEDAAMLEDLHPKYGEVPPRLAIEILSPSDKAGQITRKITDYLSNGVEAVWLIDPEQRNVTVYQPEKTPYILQGNQELTCKSILPGFRCVVEELFLLHPGQAKQPPAKPKRRPNGGDKPRRSPRPS